MVDGSGTVVFKKLKLPITTVVHVEDDPVAMEILKINGFGLAPLWTLGRMLGTAAAIPQPCTMDDTYQWCLPTSEWYVSLKSGVRCCTLKTLNQPDRKGSAIKHQ